MLAPGLRRPALDPRWAATFVGGFIDPCAEYPGLPLWAAAEAMDREILGRSSR